MNKYISEFISDFKYKKSVFDFSAIAVWVLLYPLFTCIGYMAALDKPELFVHPFFVGFTIANISFLLVGITIWIEELHFGPDYVEK